MAMTGKRAQAGQGPQPCQACGGRMQLKIEIYDKYEQCLNCGRDRATAIRVANERKEAQRMSTGPNGHAPAVKSEENVPVVVAREDRSNSSQVHDWIRDMRWPDGVRCPDCGSGDVEERGSNSGHWDCTQCQRFFANSTMTILERVSDTNYRTWTKALALTRDRGTAITVAEIAAQCRVSTAKARELHQVINAAMRTAGVKHEDMLTVSEMADTISARSESERAGDQRAMATRLARQAQQREQDAREEKESEAATQEAQRTLKQEAEDRAVMENDHENGTANPDHDADGCEEREREKTTITSETVTVEEPELPSENAPADAAASGNHQGDEITSGVDDTEEGTRSLEAMRWPNGLYCPRCGSERIKGAPPSTRQAHRCAECKLLFSVKSRSLMAQSRASDGAWAEAIRVVMASSGGITGTKLNESLGCGAGACRDMISRIKEGAAMLEQGGNKDGTVEALLNVGDPKTGERAAERRKEASAPARAKRAAKVEKTTSTSDDAGDKSTQNTAAQAKGRDEELTGPHAIAEMQQIVERLERLEQRVEQHNREAGIEALLREILQELRVRTVPAGPDQRETCPNCRSDQTSPVGHNARQCQTCRCTWATRPEVQDTA